MYIYTQFFVSLFVLRFDLSLSHLFICWHFSSSSNPGKTNSHLILKCKQQYGKLVGMLELYSCLLISSPWSNHPTCLVLMILFVRLLRLFTISLVCLISFLHACNVGCRGIYKYMEANVDADHIKHHNLLKIISSRSRD